MRRALVAVAMATVALPARAAADEPPSWRAVRGTLAAGREPGSFVLASDGAPGRYSVGELTSRQAVALPYRLELRWRRLGPEAGRSMHVLAAGGVVLIKSGRIAFYAYDDAAFLSGGAWQPLPAHAAHAEQHVVVTQTHREVVVEIDGRIAARYRLTAPQTETHVGVGMKAAPGYRSKLYVRGLAVTPVQ